MSELGVRFCVCLVGVSVVSRAAVRQRVMCANRECARARARARVHARSIKTESSFDEPAG